MSEDPIAESRAEIASIKAALNELDARPHHQRFAGSLVLALREGEGSAGRQSCGPANPVFHKVFDANLHLSFQRRWGKAMRAVKTDNEKRREQAQAHPEDFAEASPWTWSIRLHYKINAWCEAEIGPITLITENDGKECYIRFSSLEDRRRFEERWRGADGVRDLSV